MPNLYYINSSNFGDALNPLLYKAITGRDCVRAAVNEPDKILAIGSIAHCAEPGDTIWGTGVMKESFDFHCDSSTKVLAVRGPLTARLLYERGVSLKKTIFADPALLLPHFFEFAPRHFGGMGNYLVIPHYVDVEKALKYTWPKTWKVVSPMMNTMTLLEDIVYAEGVLTSSLHGLIVAEAYGVPAFWCEFSDNVAGNGFKFWDYYLSTFRKPPSPIQIRGDKLPENLEGYVNLAERENIWDIGEGLLYTITQKLLEICPF